MNFIFMKNNFRTFFSKADIFPSSPLGSSLDAFKLSWKHWHQLERSKPCDSSLIVHNNRDHF